MRIIIVAPNTDGGEEAQPVPHALNASFIGLIENDRDTSGGVYTTQPNGRMKQDGNESMALAFIMGENSTPMRRKLGAKMYKPGEIFTANPMCLVYDIDNQVMLYSPRDHMDEFPLAYQTWLAYYPEWPDPDTRTKLFIIALATQAVTVPLSGITNTLDALL